MHTFNSKKLTNESLLVLVCSISLLLSVSLFRYLIIPQYLTLSIGKKELEHYNSLISSENGIAKIKRHIIEKIEVLKNRLEPSAEYKKITSDVSSFIETLISIARKSDIRFVRIQPDEVVETTEYSLSPIMLVCITTYHELGQFISALEKMPALFRVDRLAVDAAVDGRCNVRLLVTCLVPRGNQID